MPLIIAPINVDLVINKVSLDDKTKKHLANLGLIKNSIIRIISNECGSLICQIKEGRIALDSTIASRILVF